MDRRDYMAMTGGAPEKLTVVIYDEHGDEIEIELPSKWVVCETCRGNGKHVNPSIDHNGISMREFYEDPDFAEDYFGGVYDVTCYECHGKRVVPGVDEDACDPDLLKAYRAHLREEAEYHRMCEMERRMEY